MAIDSGHIICLLIGAASGIMAGGALIWAVMRHKRKKQMQVESLRMKHEIKREYNREKIMEQNRKLTHQNEQQKRFNMALIEKLKECDPSGIDAYIRIEKIIFDE